MTVIAESPVPIYTTAGNHDIHGYNLDTYERTSLRLLELLVPKFRVINSPGYPFLCDDVAVTFTPSTGQVDRDGYGYSPAHRHSDTRFHIHIAHGMLLDHIPPFDRYTLIKDVQTTADLILTGHDHQGFGIYKRADGKLFCNPGSLTRLSASAGEMERPIQVALITIDSDIVDIQLIALQSAKAGSEVLDRSKIEAEQQRQYAMEEFAALIQTGNGDKVLLNINDIVEAIATKEAYDPAVVQKTLEKIQEQQANIL
ncbi:hypothetical protein SDC9_128156 [bioreactor metagenome]|uniref:Calcineurin-like phosphoesterase domain-containing protein n=1 Tax=bioreactor metagenome TaxID=1076179 RepID=A0A645CW09_9ZZZZ